MKVFISADMEGLATSTVWNNVSPDHSSYSLHTEQMTKEVLAACEGAFAAGATEIVIKDAHGPATNIDVTKMPENVTLLRNWSGHPYAMVEGIDKTFAAAMFIGYHSPAGCAGNPLSHTFTGRHVYLKINDRLASEFMLYSFAAAMEGVPTVLLSGDKSLCDSEKKFNPDIMTVPTKDGRGSLTMNYSPETVVKNIRKEAESAVKNAGKLKPLTLPKHFKAEIYYKEPSTAETVSYFPNVKKISDNIVVFESDNFYDILLTCLWIL